MNFRWLALLIIVACAFAIGQETSKTNAPPPIKITAGAAREHIDAEASVTGKIAEVNRAQRVVRLNFDHAFPRQTFTAIIFADRTNLFPELDKLLGKTVEVSGRIADYRGRPEIILVNTNQLRVVEEEEEK